MDKGIIIPAFNTTTSDGKTIDYISMARTAAYVAKHNLNVPVCLITDNTVGNYPEFDKIISVLPPEPQKRAMSDASGITTYSWKNNIRVDAFLLSPYEKTMLIDADFFILDDDLAFLFDTNVDFFMPDRMFDSTGRNVYPTVVGSSQIPMRWATVLYFNTNAGKYFEAAKMIRDNYDFYSLLIGFPKTPIRNDYIFSLAYWMVEGVNIMPNYSLFAWPPEVKVTTEHHGYNNMYLYANDPSNSSMSGVIRASKNIHIMDKFLDEEQLRMIRRTTLTHTEAYGGLNPSTFEPYELKEV